MSEAQLEVRVRCSGCGVSVPYGAFLAHSFHDGPVQLGEVVVERRSVTPWLPDLPAIPT